MVNRFFLKNSMNSLNNKNYQTDKIPSWCSGCGNFLLMAFIQQVLSEKKIPSEKIAIAYDIGCAGNMADFIKTYAIHTLHGRIIPVAMGIKYFNPKLTVIGVGGDGGVYGEGLNHLIAATRANIDITVLVSNNSLYSLTTGQASPTTPLGSKTKSTPRGTDLVSLNPVKLVKGVNKNIFAHKVNTKNPMRLKEAIKKALSFKGFSLLDIEQECTVFGKQIKG